MISQDVLLSDLSVNFHSLFLYVIHTNSSKGQSPELTFTCKFLIVMLPKNYILNSMSDLTGFLIVKNPNIIRKLYENKNAFQ